ncbi:MAG: adenylate/guanylate cyclase domain-containing protein [Chlamydiota bacterium]
MSIRYYLLLLAGCITTLVSVGSFFLDNVILTEDLQKGRQEGLTVIKTIHEKKRDGEEKFLASLIAKNLSQINATLEVISSFNPLMEWFSSTEEHKMKGTWNNAANLIQQDDWIGFLQNTTESELLSLLVPEKGPFFEVEEHPIQEGLAWVYVIGSVAYENPFLGIKIPIKVVDPDTEEVSSFLGAGVVPTVYILYEPNRFKTLHFSLEKKDPSLFFDQTPFAGGGIEVDEVAFLTNLSKAVAFMQDPSRKIPPSKETKFPLVPKEESQKTFSEKLEEDFLERVSYSNELFLIWQASILREMKVFGDKEKEQYWPDIMSFSDNSLQKSQAFFIKPIMDFSKPLFDDAAFFAANPPKLEKSFVSSSGAIIKSPQNNRAFLVNTAKLSLPVGEKKFESLLTLGIDLNETLKTIIASSERYCSIFSQGEILVNIAPEGRGEIPSQVLTPIWSSQLQVPMGTVEIAGVLYYFTRMQPNPDIDMHFFLFEPRKEEFNFLYTFEEKVRAVVDRNRMNKSILELLTIFVLWILLLDVAKKITDPIVALSAALKHVKKGNWELIKMPKLSFKKNNEIKQLFDSFQDMVEGMKEKEKITGILNKVVSEEIAKEILKGDVKLGGEERVVSMLFADIRGFTNLTQSMNPHEVIEFLNKCMTKLSNAVEDNKGVIDKYMGDGLMALYGAPISYEESALHAIISGLAMIDTLKQWNQERIRDKLSPIYVGIGIHTGSVFAGNMGAQNRLNYTVIGSSVNLASRLCAAAGPEELLISEDTYTQPCVKHNVEVQDKGLMAFKGFDEKKQVFKVVRLIAKDATKFLMEEKT